MEKINIQRKLDKLPTLIEKLKFIEEVFSTDEETLKDVIREVGVESFKQEMPLFASQAESEVPELTELSGIDTYVGLAIQAGYSNYFSDYVIEAYRGNPVIDDALWGKPIHKRFNRDRKRSKWNQNKKAYRELIGDSKPKKAPEPKVSREVRDLFGRLGLGPEFINPSYEIGDFKHPIAYLDHKIKNYKQRQVNARR